MHWAEYLPTKRVNRNYAIKRIRPRIVIPIIILRNFAMRLEKAINQFYNLFEYTAINND